MLNEKARPRIVFAVAASIGLLVAVTVLVRIWLPTLALLRFFPLYSPFQRVAILTKLLSPLLSFLLVVGWVWILWVLATYVLSWCKRGVFSSEANAHRTGAGLASSGRPVVHKRVAVPPGLQIDPETPLIRLPITPLPVNAQETHNEPTARDAHIVEQEGIQAEGEGKEDQRETPSESSISPPPSETSSVDMQEPVHPVFSLQLPETPVQAPAVTLTLLKQMRCFLRADDGTTVEVRLRLGENAIRLSVLAYIAWRCGKPVDRDKLLTYVIARGKRQDMTTVQLGEVFDAAKMYLRQDLDRAKRELTQQGHPVSGTPDFFGYESGFYSLPPSCHVADLERVDECYATIEDARKEGVLDEKSRSPLPQHVITACSNLIDAYPGDLLKDLLDKFPDEFGPWVKEPVTLYRDKYLAALLLLARHESTLGNGQDDTMQSEKEHRQHQERAAQLFFDYAMYSLNTRWDRKVKFAYRDQAGKDGERVVRAERAIRRSIVELGKLGHSDAIDQAYITFKERMQALSEGTWQPNPDTERDVAAAKRTATGAYRFPALGHVQQEAD